ncbi:hypothetical protein F5B18DRAFT_668674 [Nemania serpens]|nr:hypothetical protein F5B18DRAFT_668674 [Nemania serpens]
MRFLKTRPYLLEWLGSAFYAQLLALFLNMLLREDETRGAPALESAPQSELVTICSLLNERKKQGKYGFSTKDNIRKLSETTSTAEMATVKTEKVTTSNAAYERDRGTKTPDWERVYANPLPEHYLLSGLFFARKAEPEFYSKSRENPTDDAVVVACPPAPEATRVAVQTAAVPESESEA